MELVKKENHFQILSKSVKEVDIPTGKGIEIEGYASTKDKDRYGDIVEPTAFEKAMKEYSLNPILLLQHDANKPIGTVKEFYIDNNGLFIKALVTEDIDGVMNKVKNGVLKGFSIGFRLKDFDIEYEKDAKGEIIDRTQIIKDLELFEISLVSIPANPYALRKSLSDCFTTKEMEMPEEKMEEIKNEVEEVEAIAEETDKHDSEDFENEIKEADENSEISQSEEETAENVDEKPTTEVVEKDETEMKSFEAMRKEFDNAYVKDFEFKTAVKKFEALETKYNETQKILSSVVEVMKGLHDMITKTVVDKSYKYDGPIVKDTTKDAIEDAVKFIKKL